MRSAVTSSIALLIFVNLVACTPPEPLDLSRHADRLLAARANAPLLRPEFVTPMSREFLRSSDSLGRSDIIDFFVGNGLIVANVAGQHAVVELLKYTDSSASALLAHTFDAGQLRVLGTADSTFVWVLDQRTGDVFLEDAGANRRPRGAFQPLDSVHTACLTSIGVAYFVDRREPDAIWQQEFHGSVGDDMPHRVAHAKVFTPDKGLPELRGNANAYCVLFTENGDSFFVMNPAVEQLTGVEYVESARNVLDEERTIDRWKRMQQERRRPVASAKDIASDGQLIAVLFAGRSTEALRLIDFYHPSIGYRGSVRLPMRAERIALAYGRLYALTRGATEALLVSFVIPAEYRITVDSLPTEQLEGRVPKSLGETRLDPKP